MVEERGRPIIGRTVPKVKHLLVLNGLNAAHNKA
jgi:hypothetical protein